jgi:type I restriction enzyme, S subunit
VSPVADLIREHCSRGVGRRQLGSLGKRNKGTSITASKMKTIREEGGPIRVFAAGATFADVDEKAVPAKDVVRVPSIIVKSRGHIGFAFYDRPFTHKTEMWSYSIDTDDVDQKFVYYYLLTQTERLQELARSKSVKLPQLTVWDTDTLSVPIPPLEVQRAIVEVLDGFTELEAELEARRLQYAHYRHRLVSKTKFADCDWVPLSSVVSIHTGSKPAILADSGAVPYINAGNEPSGFTGESNTSGGVVTIPSRGQGGAGYVGFQDSDFWCGPLC